MTQKTPTKYVLRHSVENHRNRYQLTKNSIANFTHIQNHVGSNTEQIQFSRDVATDTSDCTEPTGEAFNNGNDTEETAQLLEEADTSKSYWKLITERRQQAIEETNIENQQLHTLIEALSKENDKLHIIANHHDYIQNMLESSTTQNHSLHDETNITDSSTD